MVACAVIDKDGKSQGQWYQVTDYRYHTAAAAVMTASVDERQRQWISDSVSGSV